MVEGMATDSRGGGLPGAEGQQESQKGTELLTPTQEDSCHLGNQGTIAGATGW